MTLSKEEFKILDKAYMKLKEEMTDDVVTGALQILNELRSYEDQWQGENSLELIDIYASEKADFISASGLARIFLPDFKVFLSNDSTVKRIKQLYELEQSALSNDFSKAAKIRGIGLLSHLDDCSELFQHGRPVLYTNRMLVMIFLDLFTTIADDRKLNVVKRKLNVRQSNFEYAQYSIREKVNKYIKEKGIDFENRFTQAAIAWYID
ncbi:MAG: hypothetical protein K0S39_318 [Paenibacillus sp.]|jgi:hypothetical protein|nr:hypothetical protein [Paenibacillus sp.]